MWNENIRDHRSKKLDYDMAFDFQSACGRTGKAGDQLTCLEFLEADLVPFKNEEIREFSYFMPHYRTVMTYFCRKGY